MTRYFHAVAGLNMHLAQEITQSRKWKCIISLLPMFIMIVS